MGHGASACNKRKVLEIFDSQKNYMTVCSTNVSKIPTLCGRRCATSHMKIPPCVFFHNAGSFVEFSFTMKETSQLTVTIYRTVLAVLLYLRDCLGNVALLLFF